MRAIIRVLVFIAFIIPYMAIRTWQDNGLAFYDAVILPAVILALFWFIPDKPVEKPASGLLDDDLMDKHTAR